MTLKNAIDVAEKYVGRELHVCSISELPEKWIFGFCDANNEIPDDDSTVFFHKETGVIEHCFPPIHMEELALAKEIELPA